LQKSGFRVKNIKSRTKILTHIKIFLETPQGKVAHGVTKFFFIYFLLAALVGILWIAFVQKAMTPYYIAANDMTTYAQLDFEQTTHDVTMVRTLFPAIPFVLSFFAVFFSCPPKTFKHICMTTFFIFLLCSIPLLYKPSHLAMNFIVFYALAFFVWLCSLTWSQLRQH
jgi:hypothetical protein